METTIQNIVGIIFGSSQSMLTPMLAFAISIVYFVSSPRTEPLLKRLWVSAHGAVIAALYIAALSIGLAQKHDPKFISPFLLSLLVPLFLIAISFFYYRGRKIVHLLQPLNLMCLGWTLFIGSMAVTGSWL